MIYFVLYYKKNHIKDNRLKIVNFYILLFISFFVSCDQNTDPEEAPKTIKITESIENISNPISQELNISYGDYIGSYNVDYIKKLGINSNLYADEIFCINFFFIIDRTSEYFLILSANYTEDYSIDYYNLIVRNKNYEFITKYELNGTIKYDTDTSYAFLDFETEDVKGTALINLNGIDFPNK